MSRIDPDGLFYKFIAKRIGGYLGGGGIATHILFPDKLNEPEIMYDIYLEKKEIEARISRGEASQKDYSRLDALKKQESDLRKKFGKIYDSPAFDHIRQ